MILFQWLTMRNYRPQPAPLSIRKQASRLSFSAHPVSPVVATANIPNSYSEDDITLIQHSTPLYVNPGVRLSFGIIGLSALMPWNGQHNLISILEYFCLFRLILRF